MIKHWEELWNDFTTTPSKYAADINDLEKCLGLKHPFFKTWGPSQIYGNWEQDEFDYIFITLNPGSGSTETLSPFHALENIQTGFISGGKPWPCRENFNKDFFALCSMCKNWHRHFTRIGKILTKDKYSKNADIYNYLQGNVLFIDLIPYYSESFKANCDYAILLDYLIRLKNFLKTKKVNKNIYFLGLEVFSCLASKGLLPVIPSPGSSIPLSWSKVEIIPGKGKPGSGFIIPFIPSMRGISNTQWIDYIEEMNEFR